MEPVKGFQDGRLAGLILANQAGDIIFDLDTLRFDEIAKLLDGDCS